MGIRPARDINISVNTVALECYADNFSFNLNQEISKTDVFCATGPRNAVGNYTWDTDFSGPWDGASGTLDDTIWGLVGSTGQAWVFQPCGTSGTPSTPEYQGTVILQSYSIKGAVGQSITHATKLMGNSAVARDAT